MRINSLNKRIDVYRIGFTEDEIGEVTTEAIKQKTIWADIKPVSGTLRTVTGNYVQVDEKYKITIRKDALKNLKNDMFFVYKDKKYLIDYSIPNFKYNDSIEIYCTCEDVK